MAVTTNERASKLSDATILKPLRRVVMAKVHAKSQLQSFEMKRDLESRETGNKTLERKAATMRRRVESRDLARRAVGASAARVTKRRKYLRPLKILTRTSKATGSKEDVLSSVSSWLQLKYITNSKLFFESQPLRDSTMISMIIGKSKRLLMQQLPR